MLTEMFGVICPFNEYYWKYCVYMPGSSHPETICSFIFSWSHKRPISSSLCIIGFVKQASCRHYQHGTCEAFISGQRRCCSSVQSSPKLEELLCQSFAQVPNTNQDRDTMPLAVRRCCSSSRRVEQDCKERF